MSSRSERYLVKAAQCQQISDAADASGTKRTYGALASQWRQLAERADQTDKKPLSEKIHHSHFVRQIDKTEHLIRKLGAALEGEPLLTPQEHQT
jgi:hypothetical protein